MPHTPELNWLAGASGRVGRALLAERAGRPRPISPQRVAHAMRLALEQAGPAVQVLESATMQTLGAP